MTTTTTARDRRTCSDGAATSSSATAVVCRHRRGALARPAPFPSCAFPFVFVPFPRLATTCDVMRCCCSRTVPGPNATPSWPRAAATMTPAGQSVRPDARFRGFSCPSYPLYPLYPTTQRTTSSSVENRYSDTRPCGVSYSSSPGDFAATLRYLTIERPVTCALFFQKSFSIFNLII